MSDNTDAEGTSSTALPQTKPIPFTQYIKLIKK